MARARRRIAPRRILRVAYRAFVFTRSGGSDWIHIFAKNMHIEREKFTVVTRSRSIDRVFFVYQCAVSILGRCAKRVYYIT